MARPGSSLDPSSGLADAPARGSGPILRALDGQFPEVRWGASRAEVERLYPGGRVDPGDAYTVTHALVGYPYPAVITFGFEGGLAAVTVLYPRAYDLATGDMDLPGRMVGESIYRHLSALLIIAYGGAEDPYQEPVTVERGDQLLGDHSWLTRDTAAHLEFHLQNGLARVRVTLRAVPPA